MGNSGGDVMKSGAESGHGSGLREMWPALCLFVLGIVVLGYVYFGVAAEAGHFIVIAPFHYNKFDSLNLLAQIDNAVPVSLGHWDNVIFANSEDTEFIAKIKLAGALWVLPVPNLSSCLDNWPLGAKV